MGLLEIILLRKHVSCLQKDLKMRYVAAALLTALGGGEVNQKNLKNLLDAVGIDCDDEKAKIVVEQLKGKSIEELLAEGSTKLASMPAGGGGGAAAAGGAAPAAAGGVAEAAPAKVESEKEESDDDMGFGLFD